MDKSNDPDANYFKEYKEIEENIPSHFLCIEVEGNVENALDLRHTIEKLELNNLGFSSIFGIEDMARMQAARVGMPLTKALGLPSWVDQLDEMEN